MISPRNCSSEKLYFSLNQIYCTETQISQHTNWNLDQDRAERFHYDRPIISAEKEIGNKWTGI